MVTQKNKNLYENKATTGNKSILCLPQLDQEEYL